ncbi:MAG: Grx4 family monothiol glutaredoxin [Phenylobacterium sp.]|uniref:Grx4 family monothiol glutaredoxin n=1 Tax=Phenylobacterium sp. TaxID=1871053 RepID=UPI0025F79B69|nr:Grx4 family monothiol glutaredoxin [Phenylobacterium sp.]MBI1199885.1 Grx4 family monothiol glutaredoxin [Phenylobacterium sp.]
MTDTAADPVHDWIAKSVAEHPVVLFMKGVPEQPQCGFSAVTVQILDHLGVDFVGVNVLQSDALREGIKTYSDWPTIPQLYVKGEFVGGCDIVREMFQSGELKSLFEEQGLLEGA